MTAYGISSGGRLTGVAKTRRASDRGAIDRAAIDRLPSSTQTDAVHLSPHVALSIIAVDNGEGYRTFSLTFTCLCVRNT